MFTLLGVLAFASGALCRYRRRLLFSESLAELIFRVLSDEEPANIDAVYSFSQTRCSEAEQVRKLLELSRTYTRATILCSGEDGSRGCGWDGYERFEANLKSVGIPAARICKVPFPYDATQINTLNESVALVEFCDVHNIKTLLVVAPPFHQVRCTLTFLSCVLKRRCTINVYSAPSLVHNWCSVAYHSQGKLCGPRAAFVRAELHRLWKYYLKGDLLHPKLAVHLLDERRPR
jgi:uncharacterized SAM-binding protein YcdF (DUF218 family)